MSYLSEFGSDRMNANIYWTTLGWRIQVGYNIIGTYKTAKGAKIACKKLGYFY